MINFVDHKLYVSLLEANGGGYIYIIKPSLCMQSETKMDSMPMQGTEEMGELRQNKRSVGLKVRERMTYHVNKDFGLML